MHDHGTFTEREAERIVYTIDVSTDPTESNRRKKRSSSSSTPVSSRSSEMKSVSNIIISHPDRCCYSSAVHFQVVVVNCTISHTTVQRKRRFRAPMKLLKTQYEFFSFTILGFTISSYIKPECPNQVLSCVFLVSTRMFT